jgi:hypothetical protein
MTCFLSFLRGAIETSREKMPVLGKRSLERLLRERAQVGSPIVAEFEVPHDDASHCWHGIISQVSLEDDEVYIVVEWSSYAGLDEDGADDDDLFSELIGEGATFRYQLPAETLDGLQWKYTKVEITDPPSPARPVARFAHIAPARSVAKQDSTPKGDPDWGDFSLWDASTYTAYMGNASHFGDLKTKLQLEFMRQAKGSSSDLMDQLQETVFCALEVAYLSIDNDGRMLRAMRTVNSALKGFRIALSASANKLQPETVARFTKAESEKDDFSKGLAKAVASVGGGKKSYFCTGCKRRTNHTEAKCWTLHPELKPSAKKGTGGRQ